MSDEISIEWINNWNVNQKDLLLKRKCLLQGAPSKKVSNAYSERNYIYPRRNKP